MICFGSSFGPLLHHSVSDWLPVLCPILHDNVQWNHQLRAVFDLFDADGSGMLDEEELADAMVVLGLGVDTDVGNQRKEARRLMERVDSDNSRTVDFEEFQSLMQESIALYIESLIKKPQRWTSTKSQAWICVDHCFLHNGRVSCYVQGFGFLADIREKWVWRAQADLQQSDRQKIEAAGGKCVKHSLHFQKLTWLFIKFSCKNIHIHNRICGQAGVQCMRFSSPMTLSSLHLDLSMASQWIDCSMLEAAVGWVK